MRWLAALSLALLAGCSAIGDAVSVPRNGYEEPIRRLEPLARPSGGGQTVQPFEVYIGHPLTTRVWADSAGLIAFGYEADGIGETLLPTEGRGFVVLGVAPDGTITELPTPDLTIDAASSDEVLGSLRFVPTTTPGLYAFHHGDTLHRLPPGADRWQTQSIASQGQAPTEVGERYALSRSGVGEALWFDGETFSPVPAPTGPEIVGHAFGPFDGERIVRVWWTERELCMDRLDLPTQAITPYGCLDMQNRIAGIERDILGGSVQEPQLFLKDAGRFGSRWWIAGSEEGVRYLGTLDVTSTDNTFVAQPDDPQLDALHVQFFDHHGFFEADGSWSWARPVDPVLKPALTCDCPAEATPFECRCIERDLPSTLVRWVGRGDAWLTATQVLDARRWLHVRLDDRRPPTTTTIDPVRPIDERPLQPDRVFQQLLGRAPGFSGEELVDLSFCSRVFEADGDEVARTDDGFELFELETYTARTESCQPPDGGPPLVDVAVQGGGETGFDVGYFGVAFGRGTGLDPADEPPRIVRAVDTEGLLLREVGGWTVIDLDESGGLQRTVVDTPEAVAPAFLREGERLLLGGGGVFDRELGRVTQTLDLDGEPADLRTLGQGTLLVEERSDRLAIWDLDDESIVPLVDESGPRSATLWDASDGGRLLLEQVAGRLRVRESTSGSTVDVGSVERGVRGAWMSADGRWVTTAVEVGTSGVARWRYTQWGVSGSGGALVASSSVLCTACRQAVVVHRPSGQVVLNHEVSRWRLHQPEGEPGSGWSIRTTELGVGSALAFTDETGRADREGRATWRIGTTGVAWVDLDDGSTGTDLTISLTDRDEFVGAWHGPAWTRSATTGVWARVEPSGLALHHTAGDQRPWPLLDGRAVLAEATGALAAGAWEPGDGDLTDRYEVTLDPATLAEPASTQRPESVGWPCMPYRLPDQPAQVVRAPGWLCSR